MGEKPSDYLEAIKEWQKDCKNLRSEVVNEMYRWDEVLMTLSESFSEYKMLRSERIDEAVRWAVQRSLLPN